jgi:hypothetical protein
MKTLYIGAVTLGLALFACGKKDEGAPAASGGGGGGGGKVVASCDQRALAGAPTKNCVEYLGSAWKKKEIQARCAMEGQVFIDGACPTEGVVLTCEQEGGKPMEALTRYYENPDRAKQICETIGVVK